MLSALWRRSRLCGLCWWTRWGMAGVTWGLQLMRIRMNVLILNNSNNNNNKNNNNNNVAGVTWGLQLMRMGMNVLMVMLTRSF